VPQRPARQAEGPPLEALHRQHRQGERFELYGFRDTAIEANVAPVQAAAAAGTAALVAALFTTDILAVSSGMPSGCRIAAVWSQCLLCWLAVHSRDLPNSRNIKKEVNGIMIAIKIKNQ